MKCIGRLFGKIGDDAKTRAWAAGLQMDLPPNVRDRDPRAGGCPEGGEKNPSTASFGAWHDSKKCISLVMPTRASRLVRPMTFLLGFLRVKSCPS